MNGSISIDIRGEILRLHPERAVEWPAQRTLIVADTHFGKSSVFGRHGVAVPGGADECDRARLLALLRRVNAAHLIVLGDFLHAPVAADSLEAIELTRWLESMRPAQVHVIAGNHDRHVRRYWQPPVDWHEAAWLMPPFCFTHDAVDGGDLFTLSGHVHPVVRLAGLRKRAPRIPVFWRRATGLVLPAFGLFTGGFSITPSIGEQVFAVGPERVVPFAPKRQPA